MTSPAWDPHQYLRHAAPRVRPVHDLLARIPPLPDERNPRVADLGCGPGGPSLPLIERWPGAHVTGYDNSPAMLREARAHAEKTASGGRLDFTHADLATWRPAPGETFDLLFSNAALHWVLPAGGEGRVLPDAGKGDVAGHEEFFRRWTAALRPGGVLAFQVPGNFGSPSHTLLLELRNSPRWRDRLGTGARGGAVLDPVGYLAALTPLGCDVDAWETTYAHVLHGEDPVLDWVKGTALRPVLTLLEDDPAAREQFLDEYGALLREAYPPLPGGTSAGTVLPFRRVFVVAVKREAER
ncbi:methyltransferase domain-containing protein [Streptomyces ovatisporus]|uniref:Methyltransferase domain-containing protein n=1 Tax=Streptomyces ovatisporus TaxID=1128682 RepID=A0ABV9A3T2_9ACTN